jgi:hypothetical protein
MTATINFNVPVAGAGEDVAVSVNWYDSVAGASFTLIGTSLLSTLSTDPITDKYIWTLPAALTSRYQLIKTVSAGEVESSFASLLPPLPADPGLQSLFGSVKEFGSVNWSVGDIITVTTKNDQIAGGAILEPIIRTATVNSNGLFTILADQGSQVTFRATYAATGKAYFEKSFVVSTASSRDIKEY